MKKLALFAGLVAAMMIVGCSSEGGDAPAPKGEKPQTSTAPPGSKTPEQRGMENQKKSDQDGGGQDSK